MIPLNTSNTQLAALTHEDSDTITHLGYVRVWRSGNCPQVLHNAGDAERPSKAQQVGQIAEGAAEQDRAAERPVHGAPDGRSAVRVFCSLCERRMRVMSEHEHRAGVLHQPWIAFCSPSDPHRHL